MGEGVLNALPEDREVIGIDADADIVVPGVFARSARYQLTAVVFP